MNMLNSQVPHECMHNVGATSTLSAKAGECWVGVRESPPPEAMSARLRLCMAQYRRVRILKTF